MSTNLAVKQNKVAILPVTPMDLIARAASQNASIEQMQQLFELKLRVEADENKKAFVQAMTEFKARAIRVTKDKENKQYGSRYTSLANLVATVTPHLSEFGLSAGWTIDQSKGVRVTCVITHRMGHSESVSMECPPDKSGAKNPIQEIKSAITYAKVCTFESVCGLASVDGNADDDGNGAANNGKSMPDTEVISWLESIEAAMDEDKLKRVFNAAYVEAQKLQDKPTMKSFSKARDKRVSELKADQ